MRSRGVWLLALCLAGTACRVVVIGDSNSCFWSSGCAGNDDAYWPGRLTLPSGWRCDNRSRPGVTAGAYRACTGDTRIGWCNADGECGPGDTCEPARIPDSDLPASGAWHVAQAAAAHGSLFAVACVLKALGFAPRVVIALGTNDARDPRAEPVQIAQKILALYDQAHAAQPCVKVYVATIPPLAMLADTRRMALNAAIMFGMIQRGVGGQIIPFGDETATDLGEDGVHVTSAAQQWRAEMAQRVLFPR